MRTALLTLQDPSASQEVQDVTIFAGFTEIKIADDYRSLFLAIKNAEWDTTPQGKVLGYTAGGKYLKLIEKQDGLYIRKAVFKRARLTINVLSEAS